MAAGADRRGGDDDDDDEESLEADETKEEEDAVDAGAVTGEEAEAEAGVAASSTFGIRFAFSKSCSSRIAVPAASAASLVRSRNS